MAQRTLWGAIDADRRRWVRAGALVVALLVVLVFAVWILVFSQSLRAAEWVFRALIPLSAILLFPLYRTARELRAKQAIGAVPVATGMLPETKSALHDVTLTAGLAKQPVLLMYFSDALNAFATRAGGGLSISVSSAFAELPRAEQRAGLAMLVGRSQIDTTSFAAEHQFSESFREDPIPPDRDPVLFAAWLDAAVAGDREGLKILGEPVPMIELLERLSITSTVVPEFAYSNGHDAVFGFLAWPYLDSAKILAEEVSTHGGGLPPRAAAAVAALIAEEHVMNGPVGFPGAGTSAFVSGAEALRALRLREVSGAEGAIAGSTTTAAIRRGEAAVGSEAATGETPDTPALTSRPTSPAGAVPPVVAVIAASASSPASAPAKHAEHITVRCPACRAYNAPRNRSCIACGERMPHVG
ncbi:MAG: zinc ribbon domain-containing protein [Coriobacteriia bacterium]